MGGGGNMLGMLVHDMGMIWKRFGHDLEMVCILFGNISDMMLEYFGHHVGMNSTWFPSKFGHAERNTQI